jgi:hypothetical protein
VKRKRGAEEQRRRAKEKRAKEKRANEKNRRREKSKGDGGKGEIIRDTTNTTPRGKDGKGGIWRKKKPRFPCFFTISPSFCLL